MVDEEYPRTRAAIDNLKTEAMPLRSAVACEHQEHTLVQRFESLEEGQAVNVVYSGGAYAGIVKEVRSYGIRFRDRSWASFITGEGVELVENFGLPNVLRHAVTSIEVIAS